MLYASTNVVTQLHGNPLPSKVALQGTALDTPITMSTGGHTRPIPAKTKAGKRRLKRRAVALRHQEPRRRHQAKGSGNHAFDTRGHGWSLTNLRP